MNNDLTCCFRSEVIPTRNIEEEKKIHTYGFPHENKDYFKLLYYVYRDHRLKPSCVLFKEKSPRS